MAGTRLKAQPDRDIVDILAALNQEQQRERHDIGGIYRGRLRSHADNFDRLKRKWEEQMGVPVPVKKLKTSEPVEPADLETVVPNRPGPTEANKKPAAKSAKSVVKTVVKKTNAVVAASPAKKAGVVAPLAKMPPHPDDRINVDKLLVNDLRKELKKRQLATSGRKIELQARLRAYITEARREREARWAAKCAAQREVDAEKERSSRKVVKSNSQEMDVVMEDAEEDSSGSPENGAKTESEESKDPAMEVEPANVAKPSSVLSKANAIDYQKQAPKSALKPSKYATAKAAQKEDVVPPNQSAPTKVSASSTESSNVPTTAAKSAKLTKISSTLAQTTPVGSAFKTKAAAAGNSSAKVLEEAKKARAMAAEARKARVAEMRQRAKGDSASGVRSATKAPVSHSKYSTTLKNMASKHTPGGSKSSDLRARMLQKTVSGDSAESVPSAAPAPKPFKPLKKTGSKFLASSPSMKKAPQLAVAQPGPITSALQSIIDPANKPSPVREEETKAAPKKPELKPLSPPQTYEMSDREEDSDDSDSESDDEYERKGPKKAIPDWAKRENLHRALERQFAEGSDRLDPDQIFGEVLTCNLEEIFDKKKSRYHKRTSSGNWGKDHVTLVEKLTYKRTMGYGQN